MCIRDSGYTYQYVEREEQRYTNSLLYDLVASNYAMAPGEVPPLDALFETQSRVIRELSCQGPCVIMGRCADYVLRDRPDCFHVYLSANIKDRTRRIMEKENLGETAARQRIAEKDRERSSHYKHFTGQAWGCLLYTSLPGEGKFVINGRDIDEYFGMETLKVIAKQPLTLTGTTDTFDVIVNVYGGGFTGQAGAIRHGIARALLEADANLRPELKKAGYLTRDPRMTERKKYGLKKARRAPQFSKR